MRFDRLFIALLSVGCLLAVTTGAEGADAPLTSVQTIQLPQLTGGTNHLGVDSKRRRFFVTAPGDKKVVVVDLRAGRVLKVMEGVPAAAAIFLSDLDQLCLSGGGGVTFYEGDSLAALGTVELHAAVDELQYDPRSKRVYVGVTDAKEPSIAVIDGAARKLLRLIKLPAKPQGFVLERSGTRIFANTPAAQQVTVLDRDRERVVAEWKLAPAQANYPIALDESVHQLLVGCRRPAKLVVLDTNSGKQIASVPSGSDADDMSFDSKRRQVYLACGEGVITTAQRREAAEYARLADTPTADGARNSLFVPRAQHALYRDPQASARPGGTPCLPTARLRPAVARERRSFPPGTGPGQVLPGPPEALR